jgi:hypothetical protein
MYSGLLANQRASRSTSGLSSGGTENPARILDQISESFLDAPSSNVAWCLLLSGLEATVAVGAGEFSLETSGLVELGVDSVAV